MLPDFRLFLKPPDLFYLLGIFSVAAATVFIHLGKVWVRFTGWVYRDKEPGWFWYEVALDYLIGLCFIGYFLYKIFSHSH